MRRVPPLLLALGAAAAQAGVVEASRATRTSRVLACAMAAPSAALLLASTAALERHSTTVDPVLVDRAASLVTAGTFRISRNPMYVGMAGLLFSPTRPSAATG